jgi:DNA-binding Lrp family transcriptional regulator
MLSNKCSLVKMSRAPTYTPVVVTAIVLIEAERAAIPRLGPALAEVPGVAEAYSVTGEFDFVAIIRVKDHESVADVVTSHLAQLPGIARTRTHVAFKVYSQHDLEAMFSVGLPAEERH